MERPILCDIIPDEAMRSMVFELIHAGACVGATDSDEAPHHFYLTMRLGPPVRLPKHDLAVSRPLLGLMVQTLRATVEATLTPSAN